jgi:hypothetical protein
MELQDPIPLVGITATFAAAVANLVYSVISTRKTRYINAITTSRINWIQSLREKVSRFSGLAYHWAITPLGSEASQRIVEESDVLRFLIRLHLNPYDDEDKQMMALLEQIPKFTDPAQFDKLQVAIESLVSGIQLRLKHEWERAKKEAKGEVS